MVFFVPTFCMNKPLFSASYYSPIDIKCIPFARELYCSHIRLLSYPFPFSDFQVDNCQYGHIIHPNKSMDDQAEMIGLDLICFKGKEDIYRFFGWPCSKPNQVSYHLLDTSPYQDLFFTPSTKLCQESQTMLINGDTMKNNQQKFFYVAVTLQKAIIDSS